MSLARLGLAVGLSFFLGSSLAADTVVVSPSSLGRAGWVVATQQGKDFAKAEFISGPASCPAGSGSVLLSVGTGWTDPLPKVYLGTNRFNGVRLDKITQLKLSVCPRSWTYCGAQPVTVELAVADGKNLRLCTFYPWGLPAIGFYGKMRWRDCDLMANHGAWDITNISSQDSNGNWAWLVAKYPGAVIMQPRCADYADYPSQGIISGAGFNLKIGAGKAMDRSHLDGQWWKESEGCSAYVDRLVVGYRDDYGAEVVTTYDFEAD